MTILNLDSEFAPYGEGIEFKKFVFPSGCEVHIKIPPRQYEKVLITCRIHSSDDIMMLLMATDALRRSGVKNIEVFIPYLPYARQDRQMIKGEPLSLKVFSNLINSQNYSKVYVYDAHSDVSFALIENSKSLTNHDFVQEALRGQRNYYIVSPDAGAYKKIFKLCQFLRYEDEIIMCNKLRDVSNGVIRSLTVSHEDLKDKDCFIIDDICDGGGTFALLADVLKERNAGKINLIVSHGIFSKGLKELSNINHIYTTDSFQTISPMNEFGLFNDGYMNKITQIKLTHGLLS